MLHEQFSFGFDHSILSLKEMKALNNYQINIYQILKLMYKAKYKINPRIFFHGFHQVDLQYLTSFFYYKTELLL